MAYSIIRFGDVDLPAVMVTDDLSTGEVASSLVASVGGVWDWYGSNRRQPRSASMEHVGQYAGETTYLVTELGDSIVDESGYRLIAGTATQMMQAQVDRLKAHTGELDRLWRRRDADGVLHWRWARLLQVRHTETVEQHAGAVADVTAVFEMNNGAWRESAPTVVQMTTADATWRPFLVEVTGDVPARDGVLAVTPTSGTVTLVELTGPGIAWSWAGSLAAGQTLSIDAGAQTVRKAGVDAYSGFALGGGHTTAGWLTLAKGLSAMQVRTTGGTATVTLTYDEQVL